MGFIKSRTQKKKTDIQFKNVDFINSQLMKLKTSHSVVLHDPPFQIHRVLSLTVAPVLRSTVTWRTPGRTLHIKEQSKLTGKELFL